MNFFNNSSMELSKKRKLDENGILPTDSTPMLLSADDLRIIIEPFTHQQLFEIVQTAALRHLDVLDAVRSVADRDPTKRKLFIRGLGWETTTEKLRNIFAAYGDLEEAVVILDKATGKSKGYGFVTYRHIDGALMALKEPSKKIDGRMTVIQLASAGFMGGTSSTVTNSHPQTLDASARKIYVGNVPYDMPGERLLAHFLSYGEVEEGPLGYDKATGKSRGFALFVYKTAEAARASLVDPIKTIDGHQLNCKLANETKRGKPSGGQLVIPAAGAQVPGQGPAGGIKPEGTSDWQGLSQPGSFASQFGGGLGPGGHGGNSVHGGYSSGLPGQGQSLGHSQHPSSFSNGPGLSSLGAGATGGGRTGLPSIGGQVSTSLGSGSGGFGSGPGSGGPYGGSHFGDPGSNYGGLGGGAGGAGTMPGSGSGLGGVSATFGGSGRGSQYGLPPASAGMISGGYPESAHYSLSSGSAYQSQHHQTKMTSPVNRVPAGGMYQGPPYY